MATIGYERGFLSTNKGNLLITAYKVDMTYSELMGTSDTIIIADRQTYQGSIISGNNENVIEQVPDYVNIGNSGLYLATYYSIYVYYSSDGVTYNHLQWAWGSSSSPTYCNAVWAILTSDRYIVIQPLGFYATDIPNLTYSYPTSIHYGYVSFADTEAGSNLSITEYTRRGYNNIPAQILTGTADDVDTIDSDPYANGDISTTGGGDGTFDGSSDPVPVPALPTVGATDAGFITLFAPTTAQLKSLAQYMWSSLFDIDGATNALKKLFADPMDCILGLSVVPCAVPTSGAQDVAIGNLLTTVRMNVASQQYIEVNCGSVDFTRAYFGSYLDYEPYTKIAIFVPYSGVHTLSTDDIMGKVVSLTYHIDILTGSCVAFLKCGNSVLYEFNGACASNIPVNSLNYASTIENAIRIAVNIGTTVATAGAAAPASAGLEAATTAAGTARGVALAGSTAEGALSMKPSIDRAGSLGGTTGLMGNQIPYFIITRPRLCRPKNQNFFKGYPSFIQVTVSSLIGQGYTEFDTIIVSSQYLTEAEETELESIMIGGVYL